MKLSNFAWFIDLFMTSFISLRYYISTFNGYCLIIQIINQIPFICCTICASFSVNMVNPYGGQYIVLSSIGMHLFNHHVKALFGWYYIFVHIKRGVNVILVIPIDWNNWNIYTMYILIFFIQKCKMWLIVINCKSN